MPGSPINFASLIGRIQAGDDAAVEELYLLFQRSLRYYICRVVGPQDLEDRLHNVFIAVLVAVRQDRIVKPECLMAYARVITHHAIVGAIDTNIKARQRVVDVSDEGEVFADPQANPEQSAIQRERLEITKSALRWQKPKDREILTRFYLQGESQGQICESMRLTPTQFRLNKCRAKARLVEISQCMMRRRA